MAHPAVRVKTSTSAISNRLLARPRPPASAGFTLIELLVVMALLVLVVALVPPSFQRMRESMEYRDTLRRVISDLRTARQQAQAEGREVRFSIDLPARLFGVEGRAPAPVPEFLQIHFIAAGIEVSAQQKASIRFHSQGGATGGSVDIVRASGAGTRVTVDWLSGAVTQEPIPP